MNVAEIVRQARNSYKKAGNSKNAAGAAKYMRNQFDFFGIVAPKRRPLERAFLTELGQLTTRDATALIKELWKQPEREMQYLGVIVARAAVKTAPASFLQTARYMIAHKSWWDTVDEIANHVVGPLVLAHPQLLKTMDLWITDKNIWIARTALLFQNTYRDQTDAPRLFRYCLQRSSDDEFFIRKAIGWALRSYAYTDPRAIETFVNKNKTQLSPLSVREALKNIS